MNRSIKSKLMVFLERSGSVIDEGVGFVEDGKGI